MDILIRVRGRRAVLISESIIICGNSDYAVTFDFDAEWDDYPDKTAHFRFIRSGSPQTLNVDFTGASCNVPALSDVDFVEIGVSAGSIRTTSPARVICLRCITDIPSEAYAPPPDIFNELMSRLQEVTHPLPQLPAGYAFVVSAEGHYIVDVNGKFMIAKETG